MIYYLVVAAIILFDQLIKYLVFSNMNVGQSLPVIGDIIRITYVQNQGAAFSMWEQQWIILIVLPAVVLVAALVLIYIKRNLWSRITILSIVFICGGGIGNFIDRVSRGYVVDMFDCRFIPSFDFPVFNVADIFICAGCGLLLLDVIFLEWKRAKK
ncbi:MAG: signal peptidase II [Lentihominibacter sp.]